MYPGDHSPNDSGMMGDTPYGAELGAPPSPLDSAKEIWHNHGALITKVVIALIIVGGLYSFFIGSLVKVTIEPRDTEGKILTGITGKLYEGSSTSSFKQFNGDLTLDLRPGDYYVEWNTSGTPYQDNGRHDFTVGGEGVTEQTEKTVFEKNVGVTINAISFPGTLVVGQSSATGTLSLQNTTGQTQTVELAYDGDASDRILDITTQPSVLMVPANSTLNVTLTIGVAANTIVKNTNTGDAKKGKIRVKYTLDGKDVAYTLFKTFNLDVNPKTPQTFTATANKLLSKTFTLRNASTSDSSEGIQASVIIKSAQANDQDEIASWIRFSPTQPFPALQKGESNPIQVQILAPPTALSDTITGELKFFTGFWSQTVPFTLNLTEAKVELNVTLDGSATLKTYTLTKDMTGNYDSKNALLKLENNGALPIDNILMEVGDCGSYISQLDPNFFLSLKLAEKGKTGNSKTTTLQITAPPSALPGDTKTCLLQINYLDPKTGDVGQLDPITVQIQT